LYSKTPKHNGHKGKAPKGKVTFEKPTFEKEDLKAIYKEAKEVQSTNTNLKNLRSVLAFMSTFKKYLPTRASITSMYNKLQDSDDSAETKKDGDAVAKAKEFFQCLEQDFDGFISNKQSRNPLPAQLF
jgi:hypothetical protein